MMVLFQKFKMYFLEVFRKGVSVCEVSTYLTIAILATTFPVFGLTTVIVTALAAKFRYNLPLIIILTYSLEPLRFIAFEPLNQMGSFLLNAPVSDFSLGELKSVFNLGIIKAIPFIFQQLVYAIVGWIVVIIPLAMLFFQTTRIILNTPVMKQKKLCE